MQSNLHFYKWNILRSIFFVPDFINEFCQYIQNLCIQIHRFFIFPHIVLNYCNYFYGRFYLFFNSAVSKCGYQPDIFLATCLYSDYVVWTFPWFISVPPQRYWVYMTEIYTSSNAKVFTGIGNICYCQTWNHCFLFKLILIYLDTWYLP